MAFKFLHTADLHLDSPLRGLSRYEGAPAEQIRGATRRAFSNLVECCLEEEVRLLVIAGDLFDGDWQDYSTGLFFASKLSRLREADTQVVWVRGNHDAASKIRKSLALPGNVRELAVRRPETAEFEGLGLAVHGQGYNVPDLREDLAARYPRPVPGAFNLGLLHTSLTGRAGHEPYASCAVETLVDRGYDYWALGHVHEREIVAREPWIVFPGNLQGRHVREPGAKGASLVTVDAGKVVSVEARSFDVVRWARLQIDAGSLRSLDDALERVRLELSRLARTAEGRLLAVRVTLAGACPAHALLAGRAEHISQEIRALAAELGEGEVWIEKTEVRTHPEVDLVALRKRQDAIGELSAALVRIREDPRELSDLSNELKELREKLPVELREGSEPTIPEDPEDLRSLMDEVEGLLLARLLEKAQVAP